MSHDFLDTYSIKLAEYAIALTFLVLFVPFWRFLNGARATVRVAAPAKAPATDFRVPEPLLLHPGHAWANLVNGTALVGVSEFAHKLVGPIQAIRLPAVGASLGQGEKAWSLVVDGKTVDMLSPLDGKVVAVNEKVLASPAALKADPYGEGWLLKVEPVRPEANLKQLLGFDAARRHVEEAWNELRARLSPELGTVMQDGGTPVDGLAQGIDPAGWVVIARKHFLT